MSSNAASKARDAQLHKLKKTLSNKLPAHILDRPDVVAVLEESIDRELVPEN